MWPAKWQQTAKNSQIRQKQQKMYKSAVLEQEDLASDSLYLCFSNSKEGVAEILEYMKASDRDADEDEEELEESEFGFSKKEALEAAEFLEKVLHARPDFEVSMPLGTQLRRFRTAMRQEMEVTKVQTDIGLFFINKTK
jgi:hypothetical protein